MEIEQVYREVAPKLQSYLMGNGCPYATACDIVQETFLRLWKRKDELSNDPHEVSGLAFTIARNYRNDLARKAQHEVLAARDEGCGTRDECEEPEGASEGARETAITRKSSGTAFRLLCVTFRCPERIRFKETKESAT